MYPHHPDPTSFRTRESRSSRTKQGYGLNNLAAAPASMAPPPRPGSRRPKLARHGSRRGAAKRLADQLKTPLQLGGHPTNHQKLARARSAAPTTSRMVSQAVLSSRISLSLSSKTNVPTSILLTWSGCSRSWWWREKFRNRSHVLQLLPSTRDRVKNRYLCLTSVYPFVVMQSRHLLRSCEAPEDQ